VKGGTENRRKTIIAGVLGVAALCSVIYSLNLVFGGSSASAPVPTPTPAATTTSSPAVKKSSSSLSPQNASGGQGIAPGVAAVKMASTSSSLDPTLDESAMLRTEGLVYSGSGRNIFSATYTPEAEMPKGVPPPRVVQAAPTPPASAGPPPPPPVDLKFFGIALRNNGVKQAFLLNGEDVYLASVGDIVARKYKIVSIGTANIQVEDLQYKDTQTLPLQN
jgi:hypothetical protein